MEQGNLKMELLCPWFEVLCFLALTDLLQILPISKEQRPTPEDVELGYLKKFFHLSSSTGMRVHRSTLTSALEEKIRNMQDLQALSVMRKGRCGVPDIENYSFYPDRPKWKNHTITYRIANYTPDLTREEVDTTFHLALKVWSDMAPLKFIKVNHNEADIVLSFKRQTHGDFFPFDGPNGVLAHAMMPGEGMGGDVHFDEDEIWTMDNRKAGYNLFSVTAHELGHLLGLSHSKDPLSLMYPDYKYYNSAQYTLPQDDLLGIQALYGQPVQKQYPPTMPNKCGSKFSVDAVAVIGKDIVFFKNRYMWLRTTWTPCWNCLKEGQSSTYFPSINSRVDAAYDIPAQGLTYIFTGRRSWVVQKLYTKSHSSSIYDYGFPATVKNIDAAVHISEYGKTFFFTGIFYYRYDEYKRKMDPWFPRIIQTDWPGIGRSVDAAFQLQGTVYLFSKTKAYTYDYRLNQVLNSYPANAWLGC